jgi:hypothetical protein
VFTFCTHTPPKPQRKALVFSYLKFDGTPFCHVFEVFREHLDQFAAGSKHFTEFDIVTVTYKPATVHRKPLKIRALPRW